MKNNPFDVILVGGGVMGCAIATHLLKAESSLRVLLIEKDSTYAKSSTALCDGNIRIQFNLKENIAMSKYGMEVVSNFAEEMATEGHQPAIGFRQQGNLYTVDGAGKTAALQGLALQQSMNCDVQWLEPCEIQAHHPFFESSEVVGATFGRKDGTMSPLDVLQGYRHKAIALGAVALEATVQSLLEEKKQMTGVRLASGEIFHAPCVVNTAGAWAALLTHTVGIDLPVRPVKRQTYSLKTDLQWNTILPMLLLPNGQFLFHHGAGRFTTGGALPQDPSTYEDFSWSRQRFEECLWPGLVQYLPNFDRLKVVSGWAGLYEVNTFDGNAILGEWPELQGLYLANGFSGHGFQQSHAVGRHLAELILKKTPSLDLASFSPQRLLDNQPIFENPHRLI